MKVAIACDHAAFHLKEAIRAHLEERGIPYHDFGIFAPDEKRDYPYASLYACKAILSGECDRGIVMCGTGIGVSMAANKIPGIRAACCSDYSVPNTPGPTMTPTSSAWGNGSSDRAWPANWQTSFWTLPLREAAMHAG